MDGTTLDAFFGSCPAMLFIADVDGSLRRCSRALEERFGHALGDPASLSSLAGPDGEASLAAFRAALAESESEAQVILETTEADGTPVVLRGVARRAADGSIHGQLDRATHDETLEERIEHTLLHAIMNTLDIVLWAIDETGKFVFHDGKGLAQAGLTPGQFLGMNLFELYPPDSTDPIHEALAGKSSHYTSEAHGIHWETWNLPLKIDERSAYYYCAGVTLDVTERVTNERDLERQVRTIQSQQKAIHELSAPLINVWDDVLTVPLIGVMDSGRTDELTDRLLAEVYRVKTRFVILDMTGVEAVDTSIANHVQRLLRSLRLLGVEGLVTGVSPDVAQTMAGVGINFEEVMTHRTLREGLRHCMKELRGAPT